MVCPGDLRFALLARAIASGLVENVPIDWLSKDRYGQPLVRQLSARSIRSGLQVGSLARLARSDD